MKILGIDPGLATVGFAVLEKTGRQKKLLTCGVIQTKPTQSMQERLAEIYKDMQALITDYKPDYCAIEQLFFSKNITTGIPVAQARGVILLSLEQAKIPIKEYSPSQLKSALTGDGKADKKAMQKMVMLELKLAKVPQPDDAADAVSLALTLCFELR
jgi:crossover junction endodeoxyribonuclease RuvC